MSTNPGAGAPLPARPTADEELLNDRRPGRHEAAAPGLPDDPATALERLAWEVAAEAFDHLEPDARVRLASFLTRQFPESFAHPAVRAATLVLSVPPDGVTDA